MRIKFKAPDLRAGTVAQMDSSRGQFFIDNGSAVLVKDGAVSSADEKPVLVRANLDAALAELPGDNVDPEYVVRSMRDFFGELFTDADEEKVRDLVVSPTGNPSDGLTVAQLKDALTAKEIPIPEGAKKQDLADLLDGAK